MIHVTYYRDGIKYDWLRCKTRRRLEAWMRVLLIAGPIDNVHVEVR